jgi:hypothetical protein
MVRGAHYDVLDSRHAILLHVSFYDMGPCVHRIAFFRAQNPDENPDSCFRARLHMLKGYPSV